MKKLDLESKNIVASNIIKIGELFPNVVVEGPDGLGINFDILKQELSDNVIKSNKERYQLTWPGKHEAIYNANTRTTKTLRPLKEKSVDFDNTQNVYIEGDNLEVLKILQESYLGKIKCIYIDPPYNTGKDFIYKDNFHGKINEELLESGQIDELGNKFVPNLDSNGRYHSDWLSMMYPRLKLARNLLTDDGVIFISIDGNEQANLKKICDEIFGLDNFIDMIHWKKKKQPSFLAKHTAKVIEYILVFSKNANALEKLSLENLSDTTKKVINVSNEVSEKKIRKGTRVKIADSGIISKGKYKIKTSEIEYLEDVYYENNRLVKDVRVKANFLNTQEKIDKFCEKDLLFITKNNSFRRDVSSEELLKRKSITDLFLSEYGDNQEADMEFRELFEEKFFDFNKPTKLIESLVKCNFTENNIILDFFSGSATTAHAIMKLNASDNGNRKYICVQLPEHCKENTEAKRAGYNTICEIGQERIKRAAQKIKEDTNENIDYGFRVYKVDESNMKNIYYKPNDVTQDLLESLESNIKEDRTNLDLLIQVILDLGLTLDLPIVEKSINDNLIINVDKGVLLACFDDVITLETIEAMAKNINEYGMAPEKIVVKESAFKNDEDLINACEKIKNISLEIEFNLV